MILMAQNVVDDIASLHVKKWKQVFLDFFFLFFLLAVRRAYLVLMHCRRHFVSKSLNTTKSAVV